MIRISKSGSKKAQSLLNLGLLAGILLFANILGSAFFKRLDLTEEKRFTLTTPTRNLLRTQKDIVYVKVLLQGEFPAGFKRLQKAAREMLDDFRSESGYIQYQFEDPSAGAKEDINARRRELAKDGIVPVNLRVKESSETSEKLIYPYAIFSFGERRVIVNLLENEVPGLSPEVVLNNSVSLLEYKFANAIEKLRTTSKANILFTSGHGELEPKETADLERALRQFYNTARINLDSVVQIKPEVNILIVAKPRTTFDDKQKFKLDQYVMNGGKVIWLIDRLNAELDSMQGTKAELLPVDYPLNLEDLFFKYGFRIQPNLVLDLECTRIPLRVGQVGGASQFDLFPWYYYPLVSSVTKHPLAKNLDRVSLQFPSSIDTIRTKTDVLKTILLASSKYSRVQFMPVNISFEMLRYQPEPDKFNKPFQPVAVLLEGVFPSLYDNRVTQGMEEGLQQMGIKFLPESKPTKMMVVSDGDLIRSLIGKDGDIKPMGYNRFENRIYGANKDLMLNAIEYMLDEHGVIEARTREVKLRLLDTVRAKSDSTFWQTVNIVTPLAFLGLFGLGYNFWRRRRYAR